MSALRQPPAGVVRATVEHMPFAGHRTVATIWAQQEAQHRRASDYGFDPESLRAKSA